MNKPMYRLCVGAVIFNEDGEVLLCKRSKKKKLEVGRWQFPQGGVELEKNEELYNAVVREIKEEVGLEVSLDSLRYVSRLTSPINYIFPDNEERNHMGQSLHWFLFYLPKSKLSLINLNFESEPEFEETQWLKFQEFINRSNELMVEFKIEMYNTLFLQSQPLISHFLIDLSTAANSASGVPINPI